MGRIHRYGQNYEVHIWNMISKDTREGQILDRLFEKLGRMRKALGSDRVFDIVGEIIPGARLDALLKDAIFNQRRMQEIEQEIEVIDKEETERKLERVFSTGLATRHIDYTGLLKETLTAEENRLVPEYVEDYFLRAFRRLEGDLERRAGGTYAVTSVPYELRRWGDDYDFKVTYGQLFRRYKRITFDKVYAREHAEAEFVNLTIGEPRFLGAAAVVPLMGSESGDREITYEHRELETVTVPEGRGTYAAGMRRGEEIEAVGMKVAMRYERQRGWHPEDVSAENLGFDVRSICYGDDGTFEDIRYVEVKARARSGAIRLSSNEWKKARHFGEAFWLYVVTEAGNGQPELHRIQNPAAHFREGEDIFATGFVVHEEVWREQADHDI
jgi:hypothetical protein